MKCLTTPVLKIWFLLSPLVVYLMSENKATLKNGFTDLRKRNFLRSFFELQYREWCTYYKWTLDWEPSLFWLNQMSNNQLVAQKKEILKLVRNLQFLKKLTTLQVFFKEFRSVLSSLFSLFEKTAWTDIILMI